MGDTYRITSIPDERAHNMIEKINHKHRRVWGMEARKELESEKAKQKFKKNILKKRIQMRNQMRCDNKEGVLVEQESGGIRKQLR